MTKEKEVDIEIKKEFMEEIASIGADTTQRLEMLAIKYDYSLLWVLELFSSVLKDIIERVKEDDSENS